MKTTVTLTPRLTALEWRKDNRYRILDNESAAFVSTVGIRYSYFAKWQKLQPISFSKLPIIERLQAYSAAHPSKAMKVSSKKSELEAAHAAVEADPTPANMRRYDKAFTRHVLATRKADDPKLTTDLTLSRPQVYPEHAGTVSLQHLQRNVEWIAAPTPDIADDDEA